MTTLTELLAVSAHKDGTLRSTGQGTAQAILATPHIVNHAPSLIELHNGDMLMVWFAGDTEEGRSDIRIVMSRLARGATRWTDPVHVSEDPVRSEQNPVLFQKQDGTLMLLHTAQAPREDVKEHYNPATNVDAATRQETSEIRCRLSEDDGHTWGPTRTFSETPGSFCRAPIEVLGNGDWIFPMWISKRDGNTVFGNDTSLVRISQDEGRTWSEYPIPASRGRVHPNIIEWGEGRLSAFFRSRSADWIYASRSNDYGRTWSEPERTTLPNNNASIRAIKLQSGRLAVIYNHFQAGDDPQATIWPKTRFPVSIALSEDEGRTWPYIRQIEQGDGFTGEENKHLNRTYEYPWLLQTRDGLLHAAYAYGNRQAMKHVVLTEQWIIG
ncbi:MAG TPA: sialidase family protein [Paenibacillus sp.]|uniref:sialidase family protein n=1 Tax=Paenibacillus sp. TaxID=58172 RepID=UPI002C960C78|nr:sialidase family protein [Paenibacillus sp.]HUC93281.1 sialidase family protein [Paenibacillus sp.]